MAVLVAILFFVLLVSPAAALYATGKRRGLERDRVLARRLGAAPAAPRAIPTPAISSQRMARLSARLGSVPWLGGYLGQTVGLGSIPILLAAPLLLVAVTVIFIQRLSFPVALLCGGGAAALPLFYLHRKRHQWLRALAEELPYLIDLLKSALESGHTMLRALQMAGQNLPEPLSSELRLIVEQVQLGMSVPRALEAMYQRAPVEELGFMVAAVRIQTDVGSSLAEIFQHVSEGMRNRQRAEHQLHALTAQSRASAIIVTLLPFIVLAAFSLIDPAYSRPLFHNEFGIKLLETAIVLDTIAFFVMRRIARVNF